MSQGQQINQGIYDAVKGWMMFSNPEKAFGRKPNVPQLPSLESVLQTGISANAANLPGLTDLVAKLNAFTGQQNIANTTAQLNAFMPNWQSMLRGEVPQDVQNVIQNKAAAWGVGSGMFGGVGNRVARDIGRTSLDIMQGVQPAIQRWAQMASTPFASAQSFMAGPTESMNWAVTQWNRNWIEEQVKAAPDPQWIGKNLALLGALKGQADAAEGIFSSIYGGKMGGLQQMGGGGGGPQGGSEQFKMMQSFGG